MKIFCRPLNKNLASILFAQAILSAALIFSGCSDNKQSDQKQTDSLPSSAQSYSTQTTVNILPDFNCTGYINAVFTGISANYVLIDTVEFFSGDDALKAYSEDKKNKITHLPDPPKGFYIRNPKTDSLKIKFSVKPEIIMQTLSYDTSGNFKFNEAISLQKFLSIFSRKDYGEFRQKPFSFEIKNGEIISAKEIYIP